MKRKEKLLNFIKDNREIHYSFNEIALMLDVKEEDLKELEKLLNELLCEKKIILTKKKRYKYNKENDYYEGVFIGNDRGFGFIRAEGFDGDFFVAPENNLRYSDISLLTTKRGKQNAENLDFYGGFGFAVYVFGKFSWR